MDKLRIPRDETPSRISSFFRRPRSRSSSRSKPTETAEEIHGPLGLNLLYSSPEPRVEIVFVHGLGGGSRKTWSKGGDASLYWPKEWLPLNPAFHNVRIFSFGYDANWGARSDSILNVHDFGRALLNEIRISPFIGRDTRNNPIILVAHSMGGIVAKKAYLLARHDPACASIAQRFRAMVFLATPHKGSDLAGILNNILRASVMLSARPYVTNIERNSEALEVINDEFRHYAEHLKLCSLYETKKTKFAITGAMIVEKDSAILGYPGEQVVLMNANHRDICKYENLSDPNYVTISNIIGSLVDSLLKQAAARNTEEATQGIRGLGAYLGVHDKPEEDLISLEERRQPGSCEWFIQNENFRMWFSDPSEAPSVFIVKANPGTGKSVLASYIINNLESMQQDCCYYFFRHGDQVKSTLCGFLLSMAFQMATFNKSVRNSLLEMAEQDIRFDKDNVQVVWKKLFAISIFRAKFHRPFFWIIDALDECENGIILLQMISKIEQNIPIRILTTTRKLQKIQAQSAILQKHLPEKHFFNMEISESDSRRDITLYLDAHMDSLPVSSASNRERMVKTILEKSAGCFLWVNLVVKELEEAFSQQQIDKVLAGVPVEMNALYERALRLMAEKPAETRRYAKSILIWTMCATRPLTITELQCALKLDIDETIDHLERAIASICGQLVFVDRQMRVHMVHQTARSFLLRTDLNSDFIIKPSEDNKRLAFTCLTYLNSDEMKPLGIRRVGKGSPRKRSEFLNYACTSFSEHIRQSSSKDELLTQQLDCFLKTNILSWIELIAETGNLYHMTFTSKNLSHYLQRLAYHQAPLSPEVRHIKAWTIDLIRLVAKFGVNILEYPISIFDLVPPFCPSESAISTQFGSSGRGLSVLGLTNNTWSDQLSCIGYREPAVAVACGDGCFAVALHYGGIRLYSNSTCQQRMSMNHGQYVEQLEFSSSGKLLASCSYDTLKLWDVDSGNLLWTRDEDIQDVLNLTFASNDTVLMAATRQHTICSWNVFDGSLIEKVDCEVSFTDESYRRPPTKATFSPDLNILALVHRGRPIILWDVELRCIYGCLGREENPEQLRLGTNTSVATLVFSSNPNVARLAAAYEDGDLAFFDPYERVLLQCTPVNAQIVACSPDGRTLATGNASGMVQLFDFETMKFLYRINGYDYEVSAIAFSSDNLRFIDVRAKQCNVWEPLVLVRRDEDDCNSSVAPLEPLIIGVADLNEEIDITAVDFHLSGDSIFCGKSDGSVTVYDVQSGEEVGVLCPANDIPIKCLAWGNKSSIIAIVDVAGSFTIHKVSRTTSAADPWDASEILLEEHSSSPVNQILLSSDCKLLLVSTSTCDTIWNIAEKRQISSIDVPSPYLPFLWVNNIVSPHQRLQIGMTTVKIHDWTSSSTPITSQEFEFQFEASALAALQKHQLKTTIMCPKTARLALELSQSGHDASSPVQVFFFDGSELTIPNQPNHMPTPTNKLYPLRGFEKLNGHILHLIGFYRTKLVFLDQKLWVASIDTGGGFGGGGIITTTTNSIFEVKSYIKHFFIPHDWHSCVRQLVIKVTPKGDVVFVKRDEVAIIRRGLEIESRVESLDVRVGGMK